MTTPANVTFSWSFPQLECYPLRNGLSNVVKTVHWRLKGDDGEGHLGERYGTVELGEADPSHFSAFESLTEEAVEAWILPLLPVDRMKASVTQQIDNLRNPPVVIMTLPKKVDE